MAASAIPVIDCSNGGIGAHGRAIFDAITSVGFVYLKNFGVAPSEVQRVFDIGDQFWSLPSDKKDHFARPKDYEREGNTGYVAPNVELLNPKSSAELREAFNYRPYDYLKADIDDVVPLFRKILSEFCSKCFEVSLEIMRTIACHMNLPNDFFDKNHTMEHSATTLRMLHYPPLPSDIQPGTVRCGEHSDYGTITLLFQDGIGGLEVSERSGAFVPATPVPDAVLVNTGDLLQRWTSDKILAVRHRVLIPEDERLYKSERRSVAFFVHPNDDTVVQPLDGSNKYSPVTAYEHLMNMFKKSY